MQNCVCYNRGLATLPSEVALQFIALLSPFDCTQRAVCGGRVGRVD